MLKHTIRALMGMLGVAILLSPAAYAAKPDKITSNKIDVCHVPGSTSDNRHIISISTNGNALNAHLSHGDWEATVEKCDAIPDNNCDGEPDPVADDADCVAINGGPGWTCQIGICNSPPTDIALDSADIDENLASGTPVGMLSSTDPDSPGPFTYTFVSGDGDSDNASFSISGSQLLSSATFDFESKHSYSIRLMTDAGDGGTYQEAIIISVNDINEAPTAIVLENDSIHENQATGTLISYFTTTDVDAGDSHVYTLVAGPGDTDNASFNIVDDQLVSAESFDFETRHSYGVRAQSEDSGGLTITQSYSITIIDVNDPPTAIALDNSDVDEEQAVGTVVGTFTSTDVDSASFEYSLVAGFGDADNASFSIVGDQLQSTVVFDYDVQNSLNIRVQTDDGDGGTFQDAFTITIVSICGDNCFPNGVAAGDVETANGQSSVVLWARAAFTGTVRFEYGTDPDFVQDPLGVNVDVEYFGEEIMYFDGKDMDNSPPAKVDLTGLLPGTQYYYRVCRDTCPADVAQGTEVQGRFRTPHAADGHHGLRFGVSSCSTAELRPFVSIKNVPGDVVENDLDFFVALGDTTYADSPKATGTVATNLGRFRKKNELVYRQLKSPESYNPPQDDNMWARARASTAFYLTIDDHEVVDNFAGGATALSQQSLDKCKKNPLLCFGCEGTDPDSEACQTRVNDTALYENALKAWHEYNPIREEEYGETGDDRTEQEHKLYRHRTFGKDAAMFMLDARSFRDANVTIFDQDIGTLPVQAYFPGRTLLGKAQLNELLDDLRKADSDGITWKFIMIPEPIQHLGIAAAADRFEGFAYERAILLEMIETECIDNVVFIAGDIHATIVNNLTYENPADIALGLGPAGLFWNVQRFSTAWEISTGPVAREPLGSVFQNDAQFRSVVDGYLRTFGRPRTGLGDDIFFIPPLQQRNKSIPATLANGFDDDSYVSGSSYGWTEFEIHPVSQVLTVTTWGIPWYDVEEAGNLNLTPDEVHKFTVTPARPANSGEDCLFDKNCKSCNCKLFTGIGDGLLQCEVKKANGQFCAINSQCASDRCRTFKCQAKEPNGNTCLTNNDCISDRCNTFFNCNAKVASGGRCRTNSDCSSGRCRRDGLFSLKRCD